jgi:predicted nucleic acid-binding protein
VLFESIEAIDTHLDTIRHAGALAEQYDLRGHDAVHLASALAALGDSDLMVTWDDDLAGAARQAGLPVVGAAA